MIWDVSIPLARPLKFSDPGVPLLLPLVELVLVPELGPVVEAVLLVDEPIPREDMCHRFARR
jgi:hypothetical protein